MAPYLVDVLAVELREELLDTVVVSLNTNGREELSDVLGAGAAVATNGEEEVSREVLHFV